jgi:hypothetical protein
VVRISWAWIAWSIIRRLSRRSGVTDAEFDSSLPGDDVMRHPMIEWTRATTINALPEEVWPWLVHERAR